MSNAGPDILLVEDNPDEARLIEEVFKQSHRPPRLQVFDNGHEALAFLRGEEPHAQATLPRLILLDLNMPEMDGREFLRIVKSDDALGRIPVVVLTGSESEEDIRNAYRQNANGYVTKPENLERYRDAVRGIGDFWLATVTLPPR